MDLRIRITELLPALVLTADTRAKEESPHPVQSHGTGSRPVAVSGADLVIAGSDRLKRLAYERRLVLRASCRLGILMRRLGPAVGEGRREVSP